MAERDYLEEDNQMEDDFYGIIPFPAVGTLFKGKMRNALIILCKLLNIAYTIENGLAGHGSLNCGHTVCPGSRVISELTGLKEAKCINYEGSGD